MNPEKLPSMYSNSRNGATPFFRHDFKSNAMVWSWASHEIILVVCHEVGQVVGQVVGHGVIPVRL